METLYTIASILVICMVSAELFAGFIIYRNRATIFPRIRHLLGLDVDAMRAVQKNTDVHIKLNEIFRRVNYTARHTKFEREELRRRGILRDQPQASLDGVVQNGPTQFALRSR